jgi:MFS family permease
MSAAAEAQPVPMPRHVGGIYLYECFNAASWVVVLSSPMLLYFQHLHAPAIVLALASSLAPIFSTLQIPAAAYLERVGYRRLVVNGWTARSLFIVAMAVLCFCTNWFSPAVAMGLMLLLMAGYNLLRGISLCGVMPWFTHIVPEARRGEFLAKDQMAASIAVIVALTVFSWILGNKGGAVSFGLVYSLAAVAAFVSVRFLRRVPDVPVEKTVRNPNPMPWKAMFFYPPFQRFIRYNAVINVALGASGVFWVRFFRQTLHKSDSTILLVGAFTTAVLALALYLVSSIIDRTGSRPALTLSGGLYVVHFSIWACVAAGMIPATAEIILFQCVISGLAGALFNLANLRAVIGIVPVMGRAHFLALYSVGANLIVALVPLAWGSVIDQLSQTHWSVGWGRWAWNDFSVFYVTLVFTMLGGLVLLRAVPESGEPMQWDDFARELLVETPARAVGRVFSRLRGPGL